MRCNDWQTAEDRRAPAARTIDHRASGLYVRSLPLSRNPFYDADRLALLAPTVGLRDVSFTSCDVQKGRFAYVTGSVAATAAAALGTKVCRYNWHGAGSLDWPFPMLKYKYIFQIK